MASWARIKELVSLRKQGAQLAIAHLGISDPRKKSHASTIATFRACRKLHPGAWCPSYGAHKTKIGRPQCFGQGAQPDCAAHLGLSESAPGNREVCCNVKPRSELPDRLNLAA